MIPTDMLFEFKRVQFPIRVAFTMTINKSQGQSLSVRGLNLNNPCFSHGQLYVACSCVGKPSALFVLVPNTKTKKCCISEDASLRRINLNVYIDWKIKYLIIIIINNYFLWFYWISFPYTIITNQIWLKSAQPFLSYKSCN